MTKRDLLDTMVVCTAVAFFILLILSMGGQPFLQYAIADIVLCTLLMRSAHREHLKYRRGRFNKMIRERKF
jgi:hypothetical protein